MGTSTLFFTQTITAPQPATAGGKSGIATNTQNLQNLDFFEVILQNALSAIENKKAGTALPQTTPDLADAAADGETILSANQDILEALAVIDPGATLSAEDIESLAASLEGSLIVTSAEDIETDASAQISTMNALMIVTRIQPDNAGQGKLMKILKAIETLADGQPSLMIATNMTPEQLAVAKDKIMAMINAAETDKNIILPEGTLETGDDDITEGLDNIMIGLIAIVTPPPKDTTIAPGGFIITAPATKENTPAALTAFSQTQASLDPLETSAPLPANSNDFAAPDQDFDMLLSDFMDSSNEAQSLIKEAAEQTIKAQMNGEGEKPAAKASHNFSTLQGWPFSATGSIFTAADYAASGYDEYGMAPGQMQSITQGSLTSLVTQAQSASQPHPATQVVAATIQKSAANGETKDLTLQLDPPELGRVEIKMSFGKDKAIKAVLTVEKQETFLMLQRDSGALERSLQDAGLDLSEGVSFELADDAHDFSQNGRHDESHSGQKGTQSDETGTIIESTMTWAVNPDTGHMHYVIWA